MEQRRVALIRAVATMREASQWRDALRRAIARFVYFRVMYAGRSHQLRGWLRRHGSMSPAVATAWQRKIDSASDMMILAREDAFVCAKEARVAELNARIHYDEYEEREIPGQEGI